MTGNETMALRLIEDQLNRIESRMDEDAKASYESRRQTHKELEAIRSDAAESRAKVANIADKLEKAEPVLTDIKRWKERLIGMGIAYTALGAIIGVMVAALWKSIIAKLGG